MKPERVAILEDEEDIQTFENYRKRESTVEEKEELKNDHNFYKQHCKG